MLKREILDPRGQAVERALPERLRAVVIGYFYRERPMLEIAAELGVTESRSSSSRAPRMRVAAWRSKLAPARGPSSGPPGPGRAWPPTTGRRG